MAESISAIFRLKPSRCSYVCALRYRLLESGSSRRSKIAREWDVLQRRIQTVGFAIREWDFLALRTLHVEASN